MKNMSKHQALFSAICWTGASLSFGIALLFRDFSALGILTAVTCLLSIINAVIWWINYVKKRRAEQNQE